MATLKKLVMEPLPVVPMQLRSQLSNIGHERHELQS